MKQKREGNSAVKHAIIFIITVGTGFFLMMMLFGLFMLLLFTPETGNVAVIKLHGVISVDDDSLFSSGASSGQIVDMIELAEESDEIAAILIDINSPGGSAAASEEVASAIREAKKPTIALIRDVGASGAYWAASAADTIIASPVSITGSIGVSASYLEFSGLFEDYGVGYERLVSGQYKDMGSPYRNLTAEEREIMQVLIDDIQEHFIASVAENRNMEAEKMRELATGMVYTGRQAKELGLVDILGDKSTAEALLKEKGIEEVDFVEYEILEPLFGSLFSMGSKAEPSIKDVFPSYMISATT
ncbi:signal peptide peptidase SppA [Candidatus Woesearchaeota archaeon]|nr:signal peptide peptidase SppA [Candidatus Woesearchaeota archaeon]